MLILCVRIIALYIKMSELFLTKLKSTGSSNGVRERDYTCEIGRQKLDKRLQISKLTPCWLTLSCPLLKLKTFQLLFLKFWHSWWSNFSKTRMETSRIKRELTQQNWGKVRNLKGACIVIKREFINFA